TPIKPTNPQRGSSQTAPASSWSSLIRLSSPTACAPRLLQVQESESFCIRSTNQSVISSVPIKLQQPSFMSDLDVQLPSAFDPFAEANAEDSGAGPGTKDYVHVRIQQRNGRKSLTTVQGLKKEFSYNKILKDLKKEFCCNGTVVQDPELGQVIQLQGDQRKNVATFLVQAGIAKKENIKIHGF
ncbi:hypothetical protein BDA96_09G196600, partial [Sorghum bicolor]